MKLLKNPCLGLPGCRLQKLVCSCDPELDADSFKQEIDAKAGRKRCMFRSSGVRTCFAVGRIPSLNRYSSRPRAKAENTRQSVSEPSLQTGLGRTIWALSIRCPHSDFESEADAEEKQQGHKDSAYQRVAATVAVPITSSLQRQRWRQALLRLRRLYDTVPGPILQCDC